MSTTDDKQDAWTPERARAAQERCAAAPEGPWGVFEQDCLCWITGPTSIIGNEGEMSRAVAAFIAAARTDLPSALRALATAQGRLQHAHDSANKLYQAARGVCTADTDALRFETQKQIAILRAAIEPAEEAACLAEVQRRDAMAAEIERLRDDRDEARRDRDALAAKVETMIGVTAEAKPLDPSDKAAIAASWERAKQAPACTGPNKRGAS